MEFVGHWKRKFELVVGTKGKRDKAKQLTFIDAIAQIAFPFFAIHKIYKRIDVGSACAASNYRRALNDGKVLQEANNTKDINACVYLRVTIVFSAILYFIFVK